MSLVYVFTIIVIVLECTLSTYKQVCCKTVRRVTLAIASYVSCVPCMLNASFSLVLDLVSCCFVQ